MYYPESINGLELIRLCLSDYSVFLLSLFSHIFLCQDGFCLKCEMSLLEVDIQTHLGSANGLLYFGFIM